MYIFVFIYVLMYLFPSENIIGHKHERRILPETTLCVLNNTLARLCELHPPWKEEAQSGTYAELTLLMMDIFFRWTPPAIPPPRIITTKLPSLS